MPGESTIQDVSDTALWVAYYRALENDEPNPLFQDPLAKILVGDRGKIVADSMKSTARYTRWSVVIRTAVIDSYIQKLVAEGVDTVINLGAGLDTRPYRLKLPKSLRWIEVDYPKIIEHKEKALRMMKPEIKLERIALDLADRTKRKALFAKLGAEAKNALILTEGVIIYLTEEQVATLAEDLKAQNAFKFWIAEYFSPAIYRFFKKSKRMKQLKNAPFQFFPADWFGFFKQNGWKPEEIRYLSEESEKLKRARPIPWWARVIVPFLSQKTIAEMKKHMAYVLFTRI